MAATATGTALLLLAFSVPSALQARADRTAWEAGDSNVVLAEDDGTGRPFTAMLASDQFGPRGTIATVWLCPSGPGAPVFPGLSRNPRPGESFVSPRLRSFMHEQPELARRYGVPTGTVGPEALSGPDALLVVRYSPMEHLAPASPEQVARFGTNGEVTDFAPAILRLLVVVGAFAMLAPLVLLIATTARLSTTSRERRLAALRLAGATRSQVARLTAVESLAAGAVGAVLGV